MNSVLRSHFVGDDGRRVHALAGGGTDGPGADGPVVCLVHGNLSSARFFEPLVSALPPKWRVVAPDLRGFGRSDPVAVDARRGVRDFAEDVAVVLKSSELVPADRRVHLLGWSMGGGAVMQYAMDHPHTVASVTLVAPLPPYGFGGTKGTAGTLCYEDGAGTGAGTVSAELVRRLGDGDRSGDSQFSPRALLRNLYVRPPFRLPRPVEDLFVEEILTTALGRESYPGDQRPSPNWPGTAPGESGVVNAMSPLYCDLSGFSEVVASTPTLWARGSDDQIVSDRSMLDLGYLGQLGLVPGWPGPSEFPPQPMVSQTRAVLERGARAGGTLVESVFRGCGHAPLLEQPERFLRLFTSFVASAEEAAR